MPPTGPLPLTGTDRDQLHLCLIRTARRNWSRVAASDTTGKEVTYGRLLIGAMLLAGWLRKHAPGQENVGILLPATVGAVIANVAVLLAGKVPVNLNFTAGPEAIGSAIGQCGIRTILSSSVFLAKAKLEPLAGMVFLEDLLKQFGGLAKLLAALKARLLPVGLLESLHEHGKTSESLATVIFSSGSTAEPKGIMLSHRNIISNIEASVEVFPLNQDDCIAGILPFFHSFGFSFTLWFPLLGGFRAAYHPNPTDAKGVGELVEKHRATFLLGTPTFVNSYTRKCSAEQFASLRFVLVGAEKLREPVARSFEEKFGLGLLEGYGCTEMAPVVAVNRPAVEGAEARWKPGSVGPPIPGVEARVVDPDTFADRGPDEEGLLLVRGPNLMMGYLNQPERTREAVRDGWYITGDIARIDREGFVYLTDRLSRFSKIAGEMVPHLRIEEAIGEVIGEAPCMVTAVPDVKKGERLVALYCSVEVDPRTLWERLSESGLPKLWIPKREDIHQVSDLPVLATGKLDMRSANALAETLSKPEP